MGRLFSSNFGFAKKSAETTQSDLPLLLRGFLSQLFQGPAREAAVPGGAIAFSFGRAGCRGRHQKRPEVTFFPRIMHVCCSRVSTSSAKLLNCPLSPSGDFRCVSIALKYNTNFTCDELSKSF
jgi:hypothetical protein